MRKIFLYALLSLSCCFLFVEQSKAQIGRSDWSYGPVFQTSNPFYYALAEFSVLVPKWIMNDDQEFFRIYRNNQWWIPELRYRFNVVRKMEFNGDKATFYPKFSQMWGFKSWSNFDWGLRTFAAGYHVGWLSRIYPVGFDFQLDYAQEGYKIILPDTEERIKISKQMLSATALAKIRLLKYESYDINPVLEIGGSYNYALNYKDDYINDKDAVNNGFTGIIGLGVVHTKAHIQWSLRYEHAFFDFYNKDFEYKGKKIFEDSNSTFGRIGLTISYSLPK